MVREVRDTSKQAYKALVESHKLCELEARVLGVLWHGKKMTARKIADCMRDNIDNLRSVSPRMIQLRRKGLVIEVGKEKDEDTKKPVTLYQVAPPGTPAEDLAPRPSAQKVRKMLAQAGELRSKRLDQRGQDYLGGVVRALEWVLAYNKSPIEEYTGEDEG